MRYLYEKADHLHDKCKISTNTIFLLYTIAASFVIGFAVMTVGALATGHPLGESLMLIMVGALYISAGAWIFRRRAVSDAALIPGKHDKRI